MPYVIVLVTAPDAAEAERIGRALLEERLIACVNIVQPVESLFWWEGKIDTGREVLMIMKSRQDLFDELVKTVKSLHSYSVPEIIALPVVCGQPDYLAWLKSSLK